MQRTLSISNEEKTMPSINVKKANSLIHAVGKTTLLANKVFLTALLNAKMREGPSPADRDYYKNLERKTGVDFSRGLIAEISNAQIKNSLDTTSGWYYTAIKELMDPDSSRSLAKQWSIAVKNEDEELYGFVNIISSMLYDGKTGRMFVKNTKKKSIQQQVYGIKKNYTLLNYDRMMKMSSINAYRLYELLVSDIGLKDGQTHRKSQCYEFVYGISRLKYLLGILDAKLTSDIRAAMRMAVTDSDFESIENVLASGNEKIISSSEFIRSVIKKGLKELNENDPDYTFDYELVRQGRGGKTKAVRFIITRKEKETIIPEPQVKTPESLSEDEKYEFIDKMRDLIEEKMSMKDLISIANASDYKFEKIEKAYRIAKSSRQVDNLTGFLISAMKHDYSEPVKKVNNRFLNFDAGEVDYDEAARRKIEKSRKNWEDNIL